MRSFRTPKGTAPLILAAGLWLPAAVLAGLAAATLDGGGGHAASELYTAEGSLGGFGGPLAADSVTLAPGYVGQLVEPTNLTVRASSPSAGEGGTVLWQSVAVLDDSSFLPLENSEVTWLPPSFPVASINTLGLTTLAAVHVDTTGEVTGCYMGLNGAGAVLVLDVDPDNFGLYAADQIPDAWQIQHFGLNNPDGLSSATNATGSDNLTAYVTDLCPTSSLARFEIMAISNRASQRAIWFGTTSTNRLYQLVFTTNLQSGSWEPLAGTAPAPGTAGPMSLSDTNQASMRFYRVRVQTP